MQQALFELFNMIIDYETFTPRVIKSIVLLVLERLLFPLVVQKIFKKNKETDNPFDHFNICASNVWCDCHGNYGRMRGVTMSSIAH